MTPRKRRLPAHHKAGQGECCCNDPQLAAYLLRARGLEKDFEVLDL
jgi:hypothetical protein